MWELIKNIIKWIIIVALIILLIVGLSKIANKKEVVDKTTQTEVKTIKKTATTNEDETTTKTTTDETTNKTTVSENETTTKKATTQETTTNTNKVNNTPEIVEVRDTASNRGISIWLGVFICSTTIIYINRQKRYE